MREKNTTIHELLVKQNRRIYMSTRKYKHEYFITSKAYDPPLVVWVKCDTSCQVSWNPVCSLCSWAFSMFHFTMYSFSNFFFVIWCIWADIDECKEDRTLCENGKCRNLAGGFQCLCNAGYTLSADGTICLDNDECNLPGQCENGRCINSEGSFTCICDQGFRSPDGVRCFGKWR